MYAFSVEHLFQGKPHKALFQDKTRADEYAIRFNGIVYGLEKCATLSQPLSTTDGDACCRLVETPIQKLTPSCSEKGPE